MEYTHHGVHTSHCCKLHGCKYGNEACPVVNGDVVQAYPCEECGEYFGNGYRDIKKWYIHFDFWQPVGGRYGENHYTGVGIHSAKEAIDIVETEYVIWLMKELEKLNDSN